MKKNESTKHDEIRMYISIWEPQMKDFTDYFQNTLYNGKKEVFKFYSYIFVHFNVCYVSS